MTRKDLNPKPCTRFLDINKTGHLTRKDLNPKPCTRFLDINKTGHLTRNDLHAAIERLALTDLVSRASFDYIFMVLDNNQDGKISLGEFVHLFESVKSKPKGLDKMTREVKTLNPPA